MNHKFIGTTVANQNEIDVITFDKTGKNPVEEPAFAIIASVPTTSSKPLFGIETTLFDTHLTENFTHAGDPDETITTFPIRPS